MTTMLAQARRLSAPCGLVPAAARLRMTAAPTSQRLLMTVRPTIDPARVPAASPPLASRTSIAPIVPLHVHGLQTPSLLAPWAALQVRGYARRSGRNPWESNGAGSNWLATVKTGALLAVGAGAVVAAASVGFGVVVFGAAGYGLYSLYQRFVAPYRTPRDPFGAVQADIDRMFGNRSGDARSGATARGSASGDRDLDALVDGLPLVVRGLVRTLFSFAGGAMKSSMARAGELRQLANDALRANATIVSQMGSDVSISTPQSWMEYTVNGSGRVEAVFPVIGNAFSQAQITAKASVGVNGELTLQELKYRNHRTSEVIDLLRDSGGAAGARRKRVVEAEYVDLDDRK